MGTTVQFGELLVQITDQFAYAWKDKKSGGDFDGSFWTPLPVGAGFRPLGGIGFKGYADPNTDPNNKEWALCVAAAPNCAGALAAPADYVLIWKDKGSGAKDDGSCWRPIPPTGYAACGDIFVNGYDKPSTTAVWCVRQNLVHPGHIGENIWTDKRTHANKDFSSWQIDVTIPYVDAVDGLFAANTYIGYGSHDKPTSGAEVNVLKVPIPTRIMADPVAPVLTSVVAPPSQTHPVVDRIVTVPFSAIKDVQDGMTVHKQLKESPFYTLERTVHYTQLLFGHNQTGLPQTKTRAVTVGVDKTQSQTFQFETAISVGAEVGVSFLTGTVSASATVTIGFETSKSVTEMKSTTIVDTLKIDAGCAAASWALTYSLQLFRTDKEKTAVGKPLAFNNNGSFVDSEFRPLKGEATETELQVTA